MMRVRPSVVKFGVYFVIFALQFNSFSVVTQRFSKVVFVVLQFSFEVFHFC